MRALTVLITVLFFAASNQTAQANSVSKRKNPKKVFALPEGLKADGESCKLYLSLEDALNCASKGCHYLTAYGYKYCSEFARRKAGWPKKLATWTTETAICLQEKVLFDAKRTNSCKLLEEVAFDHHAPCYKLAGICDLPSGDLWEILKVVAIGDVLSDFRRSAIQVANVGLACASLPGEAMFAYTVIKERAYNANPEDRRFLGGLIEISAVNSEIGTPRLLAIATYLIFEKSTLTAKYQLADLASYFRTAEGRGVSLTAAIDCYQSHKCRQAQEVGESK